MLKMFKWAFSLEAPTIAGLVAAFCCTFIVLIAGAATIALAASGYWIVISAWPAAGLWLVAHLYSNRDSE